MIFEENYVHKSHFYEKEINLQNNSNISDNNFNTINGFLENNDTPFISIIIPTYNVEDYISECLSSILNQSFEDFEIIIVDDLSTDSTLNVIDYYMKKDDRITLIRNDMKLGPGLSRNRGMAVARGKYVQFVDGDDWLDLNTLENLFIIAEKYETQIVMFKGINFDENGKKFFKNDYFNIPSLKKYNNTCFNPDVISDELFEIFVGPVNKLYLRSFLEEVGASFSEGITHEDNPFFYQTFCQADRVYMLDEYFYNRRVWKGSITTLRDDTELGTIEIVEEILKVFLDNGLYDKYKVLLLNRLLFKLRNRFKLVGINYKSEYFIRAKNKLDKFMFDYALYDDLMECLWYDNRKFFERIVYSEDYEEFLSSDYRETFI